MSGVKLPPLTDKPVQRRLYAEKRRILLLDPAHKAALDREIQSRLIMTRAYRTADVILIYAARDREIATSMIICAALANHKTVALPRCEDNGVMRFYCIDSMSDLTPGRYGILEPHANCPPYVPCSRSLCVCPCLCSDIRGYRLGFGAGYYDRFLNGFEGVKAALCYSDALLPRIVNEPHDVPMDMIVTEQYVKEVVNR